MKSGWILSITVFLFSVGACSPNNSKDDQELPTQSGPLLRSSILEKLTKEVLDANMISGDDQAKVEILRTKTRARRDLMVQLLKEDPGAVLRASFSNEVRNSIHKGAQDAVEEVLPSVSGKLRVLDILTPEGNSWFLYGIQTQDGVNHPLYAAKEFKDHPIPESEVQLKSVVRIPDPQSSGDFDSKDAFLVENAPEPSTAAVPALKILSNTFGNKKMLVILVNFQENPNDKPWTKEAVKAEVITKYNDYVYEASYHQATASGEVVGWFTIPKSAAEACGMSEVPKAVNPQLAASGIRIQDYDRHVYMYPKVNCAWAGLAWVVGSESMINGHNAMWVTGHELGHSFGLWHANALDCGRASSIGSACETRSYRDPADLMGNSGANGHFNALHKEQLGWLNYGSSPPITTVTANGNYSLDAYETLGSKAKAIKILKKAGPNGDHDFYYLEARESIGFDKNLRNSFFDGVSIHTGNDKNGNSSSLLDMIPGTTDFWDSPLAQGKVFSDPDAAGGGVSISVSSVLSEGATVSVSFGTSAARCIRQAPSLTLSPGTTIWTAPGGNGSFTITLKNNDSSTCQTGKFNLSSSPVSGISVSLSLNGEFSLEPGASKDVTLKLSSNSGTVNGLYTSTIHCSNEWDLALKGTAAATLGIKGPIPPVAKIVSDLTKGKAPLSVAFNGGASSDPDGGTLTNYQWDFGDGSPIVSGSTTKAPSHIYTRTGNFTARLTVTNNQGKTGVSTLQIFVSDGLPPGAPGALKSELVPLR